MAQVDLSSGSYVRPHRCPWGAFPVRNMTPHSTATIHLGNMVTLGTIASTLQNTILQSTIPNAFYIVGIAGSSFTFTSSATTPNAIPVWEANPMCEFRAQTKGDALASSHVGLRRSLAWDSTLNVHYVELGASTATDWRVVVTGIVQDAGSSGGTVSFRFLGHLDEQITSTVNSSTPTLAFYA